MSQTVLVHRREAVAEVVLARPPKNPIDSSIVDGLERAFDELRADESVRAIVLRGEGDVAFSVGADLREPKGAGATDPRTFLARRVAVFGAIERMPKPVIASVAGHCLGGGFELALACHLRIAGEGARFALPEVNLGLAPGFAGIRRIVRTAGRARALDLLLTGRTLEASEALRERLVHEVVPDADVHERAHALARELGAKAPLAVAAILRVVEASESLSVEELESHELDAVASLVGTDDSREAVQAFFEKRAPVFRGR